MALNNFKNYYSRPSLIKPNVDKSLDKSRKGQMNFCSHIFPFTLKW